MIAFHSFTKLYGRQRAVEGLNLSVGVGEVVAQLLAKAKAAEAKPADAKAPETKPADGKTEAKNGEAKAADTKETAR